MEEQYWDSRGASHGLLNRPRPDDRTANGQLEQASGHVSQRRSLWGHRAQRRRVTVRRRSDSRHRGCSYARGGGTSGTTSSERGKASGATTRSLTRRPSVVRSGAAARDAGAAEQVRIAAQSAGIPESGQCDVCSVSAGAPSTCTCWSLAMPACIDICSSAHATPLTCQGDWNRRRVESSAARRRKRGTARLGGRLGWIRALADRRVAGRSAL